MVKHPPPGQLFGSPRQCVRLSRNGRSIALFIVEGCKFYAVENICTHQGGSLGIR
jgi:nitrite reductase/ring-hydroxylating ferredoxin subunit